MHLNLWTTAANFQRAYPVWMEGPFLELSPEQVDNDVATWWRQMYKMGKALVGLEGPLQVVAHVKLKLDEFKAHLPLIHAMLNPGMRERHWRKVKDDAGRSVQPNEMSTLHSLIEQQVLPLPLPPTPAPTPTPTPTPTPHPTPTPTPTPHQEGERLRHARELLGEAAAEGWRENQAR